MAVLFFVLAALACTAHCKPSGDPGVVLKKSSEASANAGDHKSKLSPPWIREMEGFEQEINKAMEAVWPLLNMLFGFDSSDEFDDDDYDSSEGTCTDEMIIQLVPDDSNEVSPTTTEDVPPTPVAVPEAPVPVLITTTTKAPTDDNPLDKID